MGEVYRATDRRLRREVAVKVLLPEFSSLPNYRSRFVREAQTAASLSHPNIVPVFDVGELGELVWFTMGLIEGESLQTKVERDGPQPLSLVRRVVQEGAQALAYAHARGIVHRDVKPGNILVDRASGRVLLTDFGIAQVKWDSETGITELGSRLGTARYMAPEQLLSPDSVDARADQYALGLVVYYLLSGEDALKTDNLTEIIAAHMKGAPVDLSKIKRRVPTAYLTLLNRSLAPDRGSRYGRLEDLIEVAAELGSTLPETPPVVRAFLRQSERLFHTWILSLIALAWEGATKVPAVLFLLWILGLSSVLQWVSALENAKRNGIRWSAIRRSLYVERARRFEEASQLSVPKGPLFVIVLILGIVSLARILSQTDPLKVHLRVEPLIAVGISYAIVTWAFGIGRVIFRRAIPHESGVSEWRLPLWLDYLGSLVFGRFVRHGWNLRFERDHPTPSSLIDSSAVARNLERVREVRFYMSGLKAKSSRILDLAASLEGAFVTAARRHRLLQARIAQLSEGVIVSRNISADTSMEEELDRVERESDGLRARAANCSAAVAALSTAIEHAIRTNDPESLEPSLDEAQEILRSRA